MLERRNILADKLMIRPDEHRSLSEIQFSDRRYGGLYCLERPVSISLANGGFEATFLAAYEDMVEMRDWLNKAIAAMDRQNAEAA